MVEEKVDHLFPRDGGLDRRAGVRTMWRARGSRWVGLPEASEHFERPRRSGATPAAAPRRGVAGPELRGARPGLAVARALVPRSPAALRGARRRAADRRGSSGSRSTRRSPPPTSRSSSSCAPIPSRHARRRRRLGSLRSSGRPTTGPGPPSSCAIAKARAPLEASHPRRAPGGDRGVQGHGGTAALAVLPRAAGRGDLRAGETRKPGASRSWKRDSPRSGGRRTSAGGTRSCIACARSCCSRPAPTRPRRTRASGAPSRSRGTAVAKSLELRAAALPGPACGAGPDRWPGAARRTPCEGLETPDLRAGLSRPLGSGPIPNAPLTPRRGPSFAPAKLGKSPLTAARSHPRAHTPDHVVGGRG